ncbi:MAG TPA: hypothetical protein VJ399_01385 [Patescibacteria group bacterium]|nr:hypothetical protein [Patescibacteria group bacterium]
MENLLAIDIGQSFFQGSTAQNMTIGGLVSGILSNAVVFAGFIMFILILVGGFGIIISAGNDNPEGAEKGKKTITAAVIGFVIVFCAYWIIKIIEKLTGVPIFNSGL